MRQSDFVPDYLEQAGALMGAIRFQVFRPPASALGACPNCAKPSRSACQCADCLAGQLDALVGAPTGARFLAFCRRQLQEAREGVEAAHG